MSRIRTILIIFITLLFWNTKQTYAQIAIFSENFESFTNTASITNGTKTGSWIGMSGNNGWIPNDVTIQASDANICCTTPGSGPYGGQCLIPDGDLYDLTLADPDHLSDWIAEYPTAYRISDIDGHYYFSLTDDGSYYYASTWSNVGGTTTGVGTTSECTYSLFNYRNVWLVSDATSNKITNKSLGMCVINSMGTGVAQIEALFDYVADMEVATDRYVKTINAITLNTYSSDLFDLKLAFKWRGEGDNATGHDYGMVQFLNPSTNAVLHSFTSGITGSTKFSNQANIQNELLDIPTGLTNVALAFRYVCDIDGVAGNSSFVVDDIVIGAYPKVKPEIAAAMPSVPMGNITSVNRDDKYGSFTAQGLTYEWYKSTDGTNYTKIAGSGVSIATEPINAPVYYKCRIVCGDVILDSDPIVIVPESDAPICTTPVTPKKNATNVFPNEDLYWEVAEKATAYDVYFGESAGSMTKLATTTNTYYEIPKLTEGKTYYWKVIPSNEHGSAIGCETWSFTARKFNDCTIDFCIEDFDDKTTAFLPSEAEDNTDWYCDTEKKDWWWWQSNSSKKRCYANLWTIAQDNTYGIAGKGLGLTVTQYITSGQPSYSTVPFLGYFQYIRQWVKKSGDKPITAKNTEVYKKMNTSGLRDIKVSFDLNMGCDAQEYLYLGYSIGQDFTKLPDNDNVTKYSNGTASYTASYPTDASNSATFIPVFGIHHVLGDSTVYNVALDNVVFSACPYEGEIAATKTDDGQDYEWTAIAGQTTTLSIANTHTLAEFQWERSTDNTTWDEIAGATAREYTPSANPDKTYYYRCKVSYKANAGCCPGVYQDHSFRIISLLACANVVSPKHESTNVFPNEDLYWEAVDEATSYDVYFGESAGSMTKIGNTTNTYYGIDKLTEGKTYYWKVVPTNEDGSAMSCDTWSFTTRKFNECTIDFLVEDFDDKAIGLAPSEAEDNSDWYCNTNTKMQWWEGHQTSDGVVIKPYRCYANLWAIGQDNTYGIAGKGLGLTTTRYLEYGDLDAKKFGTEPFIGYFQYIRSWVNGTNVSTRMSKKINTQGLRDIRVSFDLNVSGNADNYVYLGYIAGTDQGLLPSNDTYTKYNNVNQTYTVNYPAIVNNTSAVNAIFGLMHTSGDSTIYHVALDNIVFSACPYEGVIGSTKKDAGQDFEWTALPNQTTTLSVENTHAMAEFQWEQSADGVSYSEIAGATERTYTPEANQPQTLYYRCKVAYKPEAGCCPGVYQENPFIVRLCVAPVLADMQDVEVCADREVAVTATETSGTTGVTYTWSGVATGTGNPINVRTSNPGELTVTASSVCGEDSKTIMVSVADAKYTNLTGRVCQGEYYTENGFNVNTAGPHTLNLTAANGCDSIVTLILTVLQPKETHISATICHGETYTENDFNEKEEGIHTKVLTGVNGCDSTVYLNLKVIVFPTEIKASTTTICSDEETVILDAGLGYDAYIWSTGETTPSIKVAGAGEYSVMLSKSGCTDSASISITYMDFPVELPETYAGCEGEKVELTVIAADAVSYKWSTGANTPTTKVSRSGQFSVTVSNAAGCTVTKQTTVTVLPVPMLEIKQTGDICSGEAVNLWAETDAMIYKWNTGDTTPVIAVREPAWYSVEVNKEGCISTAEIHLKPCECELWIPKAFSPNADGINDDVRPWGNSAIIEMKYYIYNHWGTLVFESDAEHEAWDGKMNGEKCMQGLYVIYVQYRCQEKPEQTYTKTGTIMLMQ